LKGSSPFFLGRSRSDLRALARPLIPVLTVKNADAFSLQSPRATRQQIRLIRRLVAP